MRANSELPPLPRLLIEPVIRSALAEDLGLAGDLTSNAVIPADHRSTVTMQVRKPGVIAGLDAARLAFEIIDPLCRFEALVADGDPVAAGARIAIIEGPSRSLLTAERVALNILCHLSGIATVTAGIASAIRNSGAKLVCTRKTTPGLRALEKYAVRAGGARNHRFSLADAVMIKDNHLTGLGISEAVALAQDRWPNRTVVVECERVDQMVTAIDAGADSVLLDNMSPSELRDCVTRAASVQAGARRRCLVEASGGITLETVGDYAATGVDLLSSGSLTNAAPALDIGLDVVT